MQVLTKRQREILDFIEECIRAHGLPPALADIARHFGIYPNAARKHLKALEAHGAITLYPGKARGIRLTSPSRRARQPTVTLPIVGRVAAGSPIGTLVEVEEELEVDRALFRGHPDCLLRVRGDSMRDEGILDGDLVAVRRTQEARHGEIVIARLDEEITIKRLERTRRGIRLLPRNPDYQPIEVPRDIVFAIEGIYCGLVRRD